MRHIVALCTSLLFATAIGCSAPTDDPDPEIEDSADLRTNTPLTPVVPASSGAGGSVSAAVTFDGKLIQRGKPQPQPWRGNEPIPPGTPTPSEGDHSNGSSSK